MANGFTIDSRSIVASELEIYQLDIWQIYDFQEPLTNGNIIKYFTILTSADDSVRLCFEKGMDSTLTLTDFLKYIHTQCHNL